MVRSVMLSGMQDAGFGTVCSRSQMAFSVSSSSASSRLTFSCILSAVLRTIA